TRGGSRTATDVCERDAAAGDDRSAEEREVLFGQQFESRESRRRPRHGHAENQRQAGRGAEDGGRGPQQDFQTATRPARRETATGRARRFKTEERARRPD